MENKAQLCVALAHSLESRPVLILDNQLKMTQCSAAFLALPGLRKTAMHMEISTVLDVDLKHVEQGGGLEWGPFRARAVKNGRVYTGIAMRSQDQIILIFGDADKPKNRPHVLLEALNCAAAAMLGAQNIREIYDATAGVLCEYGLESMLFLFGTEMFAFKDLYFSFDDKGLDMMRAQWRMRGDSFLAASETLQEVMNLASQDTPSFVDDTRVFLHMLLPPLSADAAVKIVDRLHIGKSFVVPMRVGEGMVGIMMMMADDLTPGDMAAVTAFANQMASAMEKAALIASLREHVKTLEEADEQRKELQGRLELAVQAGQVGIWSADLKTNQFEWDDYLHDMYAVPRGEQSTYSRWISMVHEDDRERIRAEWGMLDEANGYFSTSFRIRRLDGVVRHLNVNGMVYRDQKGVALRMVGMTWDITDLVMAEREHKKTLERLEMANRAGRVGVWEADLITGKMHWDDMIYELFKLSKGDELTPRKWENTIHPDDRKRVLETSLRAQQDGSPYDTEYRIVWPDGSVRHIRAAATVHRDETGRAVRMTGTNWDITDMRNAQKQLQRSERLLRKVFESLSVGVWRSDKDGNLLEGNPAAYKIWGGSRLVGMDEFDIFKARRYPSMEEIAPDDWSLVHTIRKGATITDEMLEIDAFDGKKKIILSDSMPLLDGDGNVEGAIVLNRDITKQQKAEEELAAEKELLRTTLQSIGDGVVVTNELGNITMLNEEFIKFAGWTQKEALGKPFDDVVRIVSDRTGKQIKSPVRRVLKKQIATSVSGHVSMAKKDGSTVPISSSAAPIKDAQGGIHGVVLVLRDITEERKKRRKIDYLVHHDSLTGLYNRRYFDQQLARLNTEEDLPLSVVSGDVNGLKLTNDAFGHDMGDKLLKKMADTIKRACRRDDIVVRSGGDEFYVLLPQTDEERAKNVCKRIQSLVDQVDMGEVDFSLSIGFATKTDMNTSVAATLKRAEDNMYRNKFFESPRLHDMSIKAILATLHKKSCREKMHSHRVSELSRKTGLAMGLSPEAVDELGTIGVMHDIGKVTLDDALLDKNEPLTDEEAQQMLRHPEIGFRILRASGDMMRIADDVLAHHERFDGKGYPKGLKGTSIPIKARIVAVADAFTRLTSDDPPGSALPEDEAVRQMEKGAGTVFDPGVVAAFVQMFGK